MLAYYLSLPIIYFIAYLPFRLLYVLSDGLYFVLYHVIGYRKEVVKNNLRNSFPEKSEQEIDTICRNYFHYLCDLLLETLKKVTMSAETSQQHCRFMDTDLLNRLRAENKSVVLLMGHYGNWEWAGSSFSLATDYQLYVVYKTLSNPHFEAFMRKTRTLFGTKLIKMENTLKDILANKNNPSAYAFIADQTPSTQQTYWSNFLNQETAFFTGAEKIAKKLNFAVVFINIVRKRRGYYEIYAELLFENPKETQENEITEAYLKRLEKEIKQMPETWLWSHKRWKFKRPLTPTL